MFLRLLEWGQVMGFMEGKNRTIKSVDFRTLNEMNCLSSSLSISAFRKLKICSFLGRRMHPCLSQNLWGQTLDFCDLITPFFSSLLFAIFLASLRKNGLILSDNHIDNLISTLPCQVILPFQLQNFQDQLEAATLFGLQLS